MARCWHVLTGLVRSSFLQIIQMICFSSANDCLIFIDLQNLTLICYIVLYLWLETEMNQTVRMVYLDVQVI